jgi:serine/threonine protein kinase
MSFDRELLSEALPAYDIGEQLGEGGMGVVVSGQHRHLDRRVAIKQLPAAFADNPAVRRRFAEEARVLASLDHPHVVPVYDYVEREGLCLLVMELLSGGTLRSRIAVPGSISAPRAVALCLACTSGLAAAHRREVLHRDVKPENMLFAASGVLKVADFGIAKVLGGSGGQDTVLTRRGEMIGTPAYIAPEQVRGGSLSPATDVYAVATMLYEMLASVLPFADDGDDMALLFKHVYEEPTPLRDVAPSVPEPVAAVVMRALATDPADRFATAESFGAALAEAGAAAWGEDWLTAEQVPIMDAGAIVGSVGGHPTSPRRAASPTVMNAGSAAVTGQFDSPLAVATPTPLTPVAEAPAAEAVTAEAAEAPATGAPATGARGRTPAERRKMIITAVVVTVIIIVIIVVLVVVRPFATYGGS